MNSSGSMTYASSELPFLPEVRREPKRCGCGAALEFYGEWNGIIGWHMTVEGMNSPSSALCSECYCKSLGER